MARGAVAGAVAGVTKRMPGDTDALALLERDHRRMEELLKQGEDTTAQAVQRRSELLETITRELTVHEMLEEKILYPALKAHPEGKDLALEGYQEHHVADVLMKELHEMPRDDERWGAKFKVLQENLEHHIDEEEGPMFRTARGLFSREELQSLGAEMMKMKQQADSART
jgi:hemerythrin-like domain-containing protein